MKQRYLITIILAQDIPYVGDVFLVYAIRAIFIFHLNHDNRTAALYRQVANLLCNLLLKLLYAFKKVWVVLAQTYVFLLKQPPRQTSHFPFGADIRPRTENYLHVVLLAQHDKCVQVVLSVKVKLIRLRLVYIPKDVEAHSVHT